MRKKTKRQPHAGAKPLQYGADGRLTYLRGPLAKAKNVPSQQPAKFSKAAIKKMAEAAKAAVANSTETA